MILLISFVPHVGWKLSELVTDGSNLRVLLPSSRA